MTLPDRFRCRWFAACLFVFLTAPACSEEDANPSNVDANHDSATADMSGNSAGGAQPTDDAGRGGAGDAGDAAPASHTGDAADASDGSDGSPPDGASADCMPSKHPGTVSIVNLDSGMTSTVTVTPENEAMWWRPSAGGRVPVVKSTYKSVDSTHAEIHLYGPCGQELEVILAMKG